MNVESYRSLHVRALHKKEWLQLIKIGPQAALYRCSHGFIFGIFLHPVCRTPRPIKREDMLISFTYVAPLFVAGGAGSYPQPISSPASRQIISYPSDSTLAPCPELGSPHNSSTDQTQRAAHTRFDFLLVTEIWAGILTV